MKTVKPLAKKSKEEREQQVLLGLVDYYLRTGKAVGSNTLKEAGFDNLSSATIRNYFAALEAEGYLMQQHISGGRIPTDRAFRAYAQEYVDSSPSIEVKSFDVLKNAETREIASYLQQAAETLSQVTQSAVFLSSPRFDQDIIVDLKLVPIDSARCLAVVVTDFGLIQTEILRTDQKLSAFAVKRIETYFHWRLTGNDRPETLSLDEEKIAKEFYNELMVRYIVGYAHFTHEEIYQTGFSRLLAYPEFRDPIALASGLSLFENAHSMRLLLKECSKLNRLKFWIGDDLKNYCQDSPQCAVLAIPYCINQQPVGAVGLIGPSRIAYRELFAVLRAFSECVSHTLTRNIYKFKISFRQPQQGEPYMLGSAPLMLIEDKGVTE